MSDDGSSELSELSSVASVASDVEEEQPSVEAPPAPKHGILKFFPKIKIKTSSTPKEPSPPPRKRSPSPPHDYVLADNPDIAFIVMFRSRFNACFAKSLPHFGPQELERDIVDSTPGSRAEAFLCAILGLLLNRKQDVKPGHYNRALEDAVSGHKTQWARAWEGKNPLSGNTTFTSMTPTQRLTLLRTLILWSLASSEVVKALITSAYKQNRHEDDLNQELSIQPWGTDSDKRRYYLIEGMDDTSFRLYRESSTAELERTWWSVASTIDELKSEAEKLRTKDGGPKACRFSDMIERAMPRFEAGEERRKRREYRQSRKEQFKRPEPGFSVYEGRTRGKRVKYNYSEDEDGNSDSTRRTSARNTGSNTPAEPAGPVTTMSGRQIRRPPRLNGDTGDGGSEEPEETEQSATGRPRRSAAINHTRNGWAANTRETEVEEDYDAMDQDDDDDEDDVEQSESDAGDNENDADAHVPDESEEEEDDDDDEDDNQAVSDDDIGKDLEEPADDSLAAKTDSKKKQPTPRPLSAEAEPEAAEESITVGSSRTESGNVAKTPATKTGISINVGASTSKENRPISTSAAKDSPRSLAFRGSPDKPAEA